MHWSCILTFLIIVTFILFYLYNNQYDNIIEGYTQCADGSHKDCKTCLDITQASSGTQCYWKTDDDTCVTMSGDNTVSKCTYNPDSSIIVHKSDNVKSLP
jgi:hypothetical protein